MAIMRLSVELGHQFYTSKEMGYSSIFWVGCGSEGRAGGFILGCSSLHAKVLLGN